MAAPRSSITNARAIWHHIGGSSSRNRPQRTAQLPSSRKSVTGVSELICRHSNGPSRTLGERIGQLVAPAIVGSQQPSI